MLRFFSAPWGTLWKHRELFWQFTLRNIEVRHKGSTLGLLWAVLNPILVLGLYVLVFGYIFGGKFGVNPHESKGEYALGVLMALTIFQFIAETLASSPLVIVGNPNFVKKVVFPLEILPASNVAGAVFHLLIALVLVVIGMIIFQIALTPNILWLPLILLPMILIALGMAWFFSALGVFLRDLTQIIQFLTLALMYASAVFYPISRIPASIWIILKFNPLLLAIELARNAMLWGRPVNMHHLIYIYIAGILIFYIGATFFRRTKSAFADVL